MRSFSTDTILYFLLKIKVLPFMSSVLFTWNLFLQVEFANTILLFPHLDNAVILALEGKIHKDRFCYCYIP